MKLQPKYACLILAALGSAAAVEAGTFGFTLINGVYHTISYQGGNTSGLGINDAGQVVGWAPSIGGFLYNNGTFTPLGLGPDATPYGINDAGQIVGKADTHGFVDSGGVVTIIDVYPGADTWANGINNAGTIVGNDLQDGFVDVNGNITILDFPGATHTEIDGINDAGAMVGEYYLGTSSYGPAQAFLYKNGVFTTILIPSTPIGDTYATGIDDAGDILLYLTTGVGTQAFLDVNGVFTSINPPNAAYTTAWGISSTGLIVGTYTTPEPGTLLLIGCGLAGLVAVGRRRGIRAGARSNR